MAFHINGGRIEGNGDPVLKNLRAMFASCKTAELVEHVWHPHAEFRSLIAGMHMVAQVSFSETFNIVAADAVAEGVPIVTSREVPWVGGYAHADPTDVQSITDAMNRAWVEEPKVRAARQRRDLAAYNRNAELEWIGRFLPNDNKEVSSW